MIRVLHYGLTNHLGGIETYLYKLTSEIDRSKFQFDFLILGEEKPCYYEELKSMGCEFKIVPARNDSYLGNIAEISSLLEEEKYDVVHCHLNSLSYVTPAIQALKKGIPTIIHSRNAGIKKSIKSKLFHKINYQRVSKSTATKLAVSDYAGEWMFGKKSNFKVVNNGINIEKYRFDLSARESIREKLGFSPEDQVFINVGALRKQKNHFFLLEVFKAYKKMSDKNVKLLLVGEGPLRKDIENYLINNDLNKDVLLLGNRDDIPKLLSSADCFLFPSFYEGFPNALLEAETSGINCLVSDTITQEAIVNDNVKVLSINDGVEIWVNSIRKLGSSMGEERVLYSKNINDKGFSTKKEIERIEKIYLKLVE